MTFQVMKPAKVMEGMDAILYGDPKTGKTSTLDDPKFKVLLLDLEGGSAVLSEADKVDRIPIQDDVDEKTGKVTQYAYEKLIEVGKAIESGKLDGYDMYAIDSLTQFETYVKDYVANKYASNRRREIQGKFGAMADWGDLKELITRTVIYFHNLTKRGDKSIHLLWIAHVADKTEAVPGSDAMRVVGKKIALQGGTTAEVVMSKVDGLFYMYNRSTQDEKTKEVSIERGILTKTQGMYPAMARQSKRKDPLPARIVNPVWSDIFTELGYVKKGAK